MTRLQRFLAILYPAALVCLVEGLAVVAWNGVEHPYLPRLAGLAALAVLAAAALLGLALAEARLVSPRGWLSLAWAVTAALSMAFVLANGLPPRFAAGSATPMVALFAVTACALLAGLGRFVLPRPVDRGRALLLEPLLLAAATVGVYAIAGRLGLKTGALRVLLPWAAGLLLAGFATAFLASRGREPATPTGGMRGLGWRERLARADSATRAALSVVLWIAALAAAAAALGRRPFEPMPLARASGPPDVLLVVMDTVRADALAARLSAEFYLPASLPARGGSARDRALALARSARFGAPELAAFAAESLRYPNAFSTSCWTVPAHASLFTGMEAVQHGVGWTDAHLPRALPTLAARLRATGRHTIGLSANPWIAPEFGFDRGFDRFVPGDLERRPWIPWVFGLLPQVARRVDGTLLWEDKDGLVLASESVRELGRTRRPAFVFLNLMEAHLPYAPPPRVLEQGLAGTDVDPESLRRLEQDPLMDLRRGFAWDPAHLAGLRTLYAAEVAHLDGVLGRVLERLRQAERLERTVVVLVGDHGENLGEHPPLDHQLGLWDTLVHVPLIVRLPGASARRGQDERLVSLADLAPAIEAWAAGRPSALEGPPGREAVFFDYDLPRPILDKIAARPEIDGSAWAQSLRGVRSLDARWVLGSGGYREATDLRPVPEGEPPFAALRDRLLSLEAAAPSRPAPSGTPLSTETAERLRSLGYVK